MRKAKESSGLVREDYYDWPKAVTDMLAGPEHINVALMMIGSNDRQEIQDKVLGRWPLTEQEFADAFPVDVEEVVYISPAAYLRSVAAIIWNAFRHPFSTTYIDLSTGNSVTPLDDA